MKKVFLFIAIVALVSLSSCSKECTCTATTTGSELEIPPVTTTVETKGSCSDGNSTTTMGELTVTTVCK